MTSSSEWAKATVLATVLVQYCLIVFVDRVEAFLSSAHRTELISLFWVHAAGCLVSWLFLRNFDPSNPERNSETRAWASWLLTVSVGLSPLVAQECAIYWFDNYGLIHVWGAWILFVCSTVSLATTACAQFAGLMAVAVLFVPSICSHKAMFWCANGCLVGLAAVLDAAHEHHKQRLLLAPMSSNETARWQLVDGLAYWIGSVGFGVVWLREMVACYDVLTGSRSFVETDAWVQGLWSLAYVGNSALFAWWGSRRHRSSWTRFGVAGLLVGAHLVLESIYPHSIVTPLMAACLCVYQLRKQKLS